MKTERGSMDDPIATNGPRSQSSEQGNTASDPNRSTDPQEQRKQQGGRGTAGNDKGSQGGEDENEHGDDVDYPQKS